MPQLSSCEHPNQHNVCIRLHVIPPSSLAAGQIPALTRFCYACSPPKGGDNCVCLQVSRSISHSGSRHQKKTPILDQPCLTECIMLHYIGQLHMDTFSLIVCELMLMESHIGIPNFLQEVAEQCTPCVGVRQRFVRKRD